MGEDVCEFYANYMGLSVNIVRPFNIYGEGQSENFLIPLIIKQVKEEQVIKVKDLSPKRDYIHVKDVVECIVKAMEFKKFDIFNAVFGFSLNAANCPFSFTSKTPYKLTCSRLKEEIVK